MSTLTKINNVLALNSNKAPTPASLQRKLEEQKAQLDSLKSQSEDAAFAFASGEDGAEATYQEIAGRVKAAEQLVAATERAIPAAERRVTKERVAAQLVAQASQIAACNQHLIAMVNAADSFTKFQTAAIQEYKEIIRLAEAARNAAPTRIGERPLAYPVIAGLVNPADIAAHVTAELYRLSADPKLLAQTRLFPGAKMNLFNSDPTKMKPFLTVVKEATAHILATIRGEAQIHEPVNIADFKQHPDALPNKKGFAEIDGKIIPTVGLDTGPTIAETRDPTLLPLQDHSPPILPEPEPAEPDWSKA